MGIQLQSREYCPLCANSNTRILHQRSYSDPILKQFIADFYQGRADLKALASGTYRVDKCEACGFIYQFNVLNNEGLSALYDNWVDAEASLAKKQNAKAKLFRQYAGQIETLSRLFSRPPQQVKLLDFGMGWGYWSRMALAFGFQVQGLELSTQRAEYARAMGIEVVDQLPDAGPRYHFIYANQVFEHLENPLQTLQLLQSRLKPDGLIYLRVPDGGDIEKNLERSGWNSDLDAIHPLEHINCFTRASLISLASRAGLQPLQPPLRLNLRSLWGGIKREYADRFVTTHIYFKNT